MTENSDPSYMGGLHRAGGRYTAFTRGQRSYRLRVPEIERVFADAKEKIRNEVYTLPGTEKSQYVGKAEICCHESEETGDVEVENRLPPIFDHNKRPYF